MTEQKDKSAISISHLSVIAGGKTLLEDANLRIGPGELVLLVGASGSGKSVLLKLLTGLIHLDTPNFKIRGDIDIFGVDRLRKGRKVKKKTGIVFQEHGLFDEFSPLQNIKFAMDHSSYYWSKPERKEFFEKTLSELSIDPHIPISHYSGGQKKRLALARTLAFQPQIIIYDEPTAGLDPFNAQHVSSLIEKTHRDYQKTTLVVTHEYQYLLPIAHRIIYLDTQNKQLRDVSADQVQKLIEEGGTPEGMSPPSPLKGFLRKTQGFFTSFLDSTSRFFLTFISGLFYLFPLWKRPLWGLRYSVYYFRLLSFLSAMFYIAMAGAIVGFVVTYFIFQFLPYKAYNEPLLIDDILAALGFSLYRIFIPIIATVLIAARGCAAVTADLGNRVYTRQIDALYSLGASPESYLYSNILYGFLISTPLLTFIAFFVARIASLSVFTFTHPEYSPYFWDMNFHYLLKLSGRGIYDGTGWVLGKTLACGALLAIVSYVIGMRPKKSGRDISQDITKAIIWGTLGVLLIHFVFAFFEFEAISPQ